MPRSPQPRSDLNDERFQLRRAAQQVHRIGPQRHAHCGLMLRRGMAFTGEKAGESKTQCVEQLISAGPCAGYRAAFARWRQVTADRTRYASFEARLASRLYVGAVHDNALETGCTVHHTWGMPMLPGSAIKGVCRHAALDWDLGADAVEALFGAATVDAEPSGASYAGTLVFHDAWWIPGTQGPFVAEVITPHHSGYYQLGGAPATDFDSPVPTAQIAVRGAFHFVVGSADAGASRLAVKLLQAVLCDRGLGGKRSSGYGFFIA